jgi:hypothetical protein
MTQAHERFENSALVEAWLKESTWLEPVDEGRVAAIVHHTPQARRWPPQVDPGRFAPMLNATKFVAASVVLALTGGLLLNVLPTDPTPAEPVPAAETATATTEATTEVVTEATHSLITFPDEIPEGVESGAIETPQGPARWIRTTHPEGLPWLSDVLPWGDGIAVFAEFYTALVATEDGVTWTSIELPDGSAARSEVAYLDGFYYYVSPQTQRMWVSRGPGDAWRELDSSAMEATRQAGWNAFGFRTTAPQLINGRVVFEVSNRYTLPRRALGIPTRKTKKMKRLRNDRYALCGSGSCPEGGRDSRWILQFDQTAEGLKVTHANSGKPLGLIAGATLSELYVGEEGANTRAFAVDGEQVVQVGQAWVGDPALGRNFRARQPVEIVPPPNVPPGTTPAWTGAAWHARSPESVASDGPNEHWMHLGGEWVSLESLGLPAGAAVYGLDDVTVIGGDGHLWLLLLPAATE